MMRWLEFIKVRTSGTSEQPLYSKLLDMVSVHLEAPGLLKANVYTNATVPGDICITMIWDTDQSKPRGSELGMGLAQELRRSVLVDHSIWIEWSSK